MREQKKLVFVLLTKTAEGGNQVVWKAKASVSYRFTKIQNSQNQLTRQIKQNKTAAFSILRLNFS
jgi:hypothetical protein